MSINWKQVFPLKVIVAFVVLLVFASSLKAVLHMVGAHLKKEPVPLAQPWYRLGEQVGPYKMEHDAPPMPADQERELGTTEYIVRIYRDTRLEPKQPGAYLRLHTAYYTGTIDTVPHVPDRCAVAGGAIAGVKSTTTLKLASPTLTPQEDGSLIGTTSRQSQVRVPGDIVPFRMISFTDPNRPDAPFVIGYFFVANDSFVASAKGVRAKAFNFTDRYAYYCKVEVAPIGVGDPDQAAKIVSEFLSHIMPDVMWCLPDWQKIQGDDQVAEGKQN